ncbi:uncharacterized protein FA14DRAFT_187610 [Meira miltonrushii]|uniref:DASH complex subunit SPC19 n=1 Tax=Meira miltonrushii TaxID=1280837 RepID=A0A316VJ37_9BASI|nr:uncharacterized protein FA14DRAFT_187610 [Meira miltonrushii]PWN37510.1 hypothetical protein FA14DRAFT_187610 [Meira miltonrushii]
MSLTSRQTNFSAAGQTATSIETCIASVEFACRTLEASNATLTDETKDLARLANAVRSKRYFDLISEREIKDAQDHLSVEILPQLKELILKAEEALQKDERRAKILRGKSAQQSTRLEQFAQLYDVSIDKIRKLSDESKNNEVIGSNENQKNKAEKMNQHLTSLREKRITLQREMAKMEREVRQKGHAVQ